MFPESQALLSPSNQNEKGRKLTPKERGCFQCSRRRIICDKGEPSCGKCIKKGIECSGVNRIRFTGSVARRGRFKDLQIPDLHDGDAQELPGTTTFAGVRWSNERKPRSRGKPKVPDVEREPDASPTDVASDAQEDRTSPPYQTADEEAHWHTDCSEASPQSSANSSTSPHVTETDVGEIVRTGDESTIQRRLSTTMNIRPWIAPLTPDARMLFSYFSEAVAPVMVVFDTVPNGYRELILPMAFEDEVLRRAVGVVAAQHLARERPEMHKVAEAGRAAIISRLRNDSLFATPDQVFSVSTWATLLVLLVGETVTGSADFGFLIHMLLCLSSRCRIEDEDSTVRKFLRTQTSMFEALSLPLMGERDGIPIAQGSFKMWQNWLPLDDLPVDSPSHRIGEKIRLCFASAGDIYLRRATSENTNSFPPGVSNYDALQTSAIQQIVELVSCISPDTPGAHALIWPCFVAGAEATDPDQRAFLVDYMDRIYTRTKFRNIPAGIQSLERLWANSGKRWTQCLPEISKVLVM